MPRTSSPSRSFWLTIIALTFIANLAAAWSSYLRWNALGVNLFRSVWGIAAAVYLGGLVLCIWLFMRVARSDNLPLDISSLFQSNNFYLRAFGGIVFLAVLFLIPYVKFTFLIERSGHSLLRLDPSLLSITYRWLCWYMLLGAMAGLKIAFKTTWQAGFASALILLGVVYETAT